jgi:hypothetical protein
LIHWRQRELTGLQQSNYRLGSQISVKLPPNCLKACVITPDGQRQDYENPASEIVVHADTPGCYQLTMDTDQYEFSVNAVSASESDLRGCRITQKTSPDQASLFWWEYRPCDGILLLIALILMTLHHYLISTRITGGNA